MGGPPCQGFSVGGARSASDPRNALVFDFMRVVEELKPSYFVMENVPGILDPRYAPILESVLRTASRLGYHVDHPFWLLNAADFGVPQRRRRTFVVGSLAGMLRPMMPVGLARPVTVGQALRDLYVVEERPERIRDGQYFGALGKASAYSLRLRRSSSEPPAPLSGFFPTEHTRATVKRFSKVKPGDYEAVSRFYRLEEAGVSPTLRAGTGVERGKFMAPRPIHPVYDRCIHVREAARLHSFPDRFQFHEAKWHAFMQIGNSVPPLLSQAVGDSIMSALRASACRKASHHESRRLAR